MENKLSEIYNSLASEIASVIPVKWKKFYYLGEMENEKLSWSSVFYFESNGEIVKSHSIPEKYNVSEEIYEELFDRVNELLLQLYECFQKNEQLLWDQVSLFVDCEGSFDINYLYDVISENDGGQVKREVVWAYETFGFTPKEGTHTRRILDKYISENG